MTDTQRVPEEAIEAMKGAWPAANYPVLVRPDEATPERMAAARQRENEIFGGALEAALPALRQFFYEEFVERLREEAREEGCTAARCRDDGETELALLATERALVLRGLADSLARSDES